MLIVCPSCASSYVLDDARIGPAGRRVRCASCRETFFVSLPEDNAPAFPAASEPEVPAQADDIALSEAETTDADSLWNNPPESEAPQAEGTDATAGDPAPMPDDAALRAEDAAFEEALEAQWRDEEAAGPKGAVAEHWPDKPAIPRDLEAEAKAAAPAAAAGGKAARAEKKPKVPIRPRLRVQPAAALLVLGFVPALAGLLLGRAQIVRLLPEAAAIYAAIGMPVNLRGFAFENVRSELVREGEARLLVVEGEIANIRDTSLAVPPVLIGVMGEGANPLYRWTADPDQATLAPGARTRFKARLVSPPQEGRQVLVRFADAGDARSSATEPRGKQ